MLGINIKIGLQQMLIQNDVNILPINITSKWVKNACHKNACFVKLLINILLLSTSESEFRSWFMDRGKYCTTVCHGKLPSNNQKDLWIWYSFNLHLQR